MLAATHIRREAVPGRLQQVAAKQALTANKTVPVGTLPPIPTRHSEPQIRTETRRTHLRAGLGPQPSTEQYVSLDQWCRHGVHK